MYVLVNVTLAVTSCTKVLKSAQKRRHKKRKFPVVVNIISLNLLPIEDDKRFQLFRYIKKLVIFHIFIKLQYKFMQLRFECGDDIPHLPDFKGRVGVET
jgi:hypothetical protein